MKAGLAAPRQPAKLRAAYRPLVLGTVILLVSGCSRDDGNQVAPPGRQETTTLAPSIAEPLPKPQTDEAVQTITFLEADGAQLLAVDDRIRMVMTEPFSVDLCQRESDNLNELLPADEMLGLATMISDDVLRSAVLAERTHLLALLGRCIQGEPIEDDLAMLRQASDVVAVRLQELEESA